jgi:hypothetical protein
MQIVMYLPCLVCCMMRCCGQALRDGLAAAGLAAKVIYSGGIDVDILAQVRQQGMRALRLRQLLVQSQYS